MKKILLVSHQEAFLERNKNLLNRAGFLIVTATSAEGAMVIYRIQPVDLIISVLELPGMGGDAFCSQLRQDKELRQAPFLLVCYDTEASLARVADCGANAYVTRPVLPDLLLKEMGRFLDIPTRREYRATFQALIHGQSGSLSFTGMTRNISITGVLCETDVRLSQGDIITNLRVEIDGETVDADGRVVWSDQQPDGMFNYGVHFTRLPDSSREAIRRFVATAEPEHPFEMAGYYDPADE
jgi:CheY-like chemotaxis protein